MDVRETTSETLKEAPGADGDASTAPPEPKSLREMLEASQGAMGEDRVIAIGIEICDALIARGPEHGDLTPEILISFSDVGGTDEIAIDDTRGGWLTSDARKYSAPEMRGDNPKLSHAADVYSIGVIMQALLGTRPPNERFAQVIRKCIEKNPKSRYRDAAQLKDALKDLKVPGFVPAALQRKRKRKSLLAPLLTLLLITIGFAAYLQHQPEPAPAVTSAPTPSNGTIIDVKRDSPEHVYKELNPKQIATLAKYDWVFVLDRSGSMGGNEAIGDGIYSKWSWGCRELENFAKLAKKALPTGFTVITFDDLPTRYSVAGVEDLAKIYENSGPRGGTMMAAAFNDAFQDQTKSSKPLAVVYLTDGQPSDPNEFEQQILEATKDSQKLRMEFLTIGSEQNSSLGALEQLLMRDGAPYDPISIETFEKIRKDGIAHTIADRFVDDPKETK